MRRKVFAVIIILFFSVLCNNAFAQIKPETLRQIGLLLDEKASRTPAQRKIQSQLLQAVRESRGQRMVVGVPLKPAKVHADTKGNLDVDISADVTDDLIKKIESLGGKIIYPSKEYHTIRATVNLSMIDIISGYPEVKSIEPAVRSRVVGRVFHNQQLSSNQLNLVKFLPFNAEHIRGIMEKYINGHPGLTGRAGMVTSQGDHTHGADKARDVYGYTGKGIKIGVLSDSYNATSGAATDVLNGELPGTGNPFGYTTPVTVVQDEAGGTDEGRAILQIVHDLAPDAQLFFATADVSEASFATNITKLRNTYNCDIILDDVEYLDEPVFQDGTIAQAVNTVTAAGALYFSSAGNEGSLAKNTSGVFEGDFNDTGSPPFTSTKKNKTGTINNFGTSASPINGDIIETEGEDEYTLTWADPNGASSNDYDLFLVDASGDILEASTTNQTGTQNPFEAVPLLGTDFATGDRLVVFKNTAAAVRAFDLNTGGGLLTLATDGQTHGHCCAIAAFGVAATPAAGPFDGSSPTGPYPGVFVSSNKVETFSSDGPRRIFYTPSGTAITPGNFLFSTNGGEVLQKPDITAADGVSTNLSGTTEFDPLFFGTSAAAPHAASIAALIKSANPSLTPTQIRNILTSTALDIESTGVDYNSGYGIVQAFQAMQAVAPSALSNINIDTVIITEGTASNNNGAIDPGENANILVKLTDEASLAATNVVSTLRTTTTGITITKDTASYGTIPSSAIGANTFSFNVSPSVSCGSIVDFFDSVNFGGGGPSPQTFFFTESIGSQPDMSISSTLGSTPPTGSNFTSSTGTQTGRINRNTVGDVSSCATALTNPGLLTTSSTPRAYDAYIFTNTSSVSQCITVIMSSTNADSLFCVTYNDSGFVPANPSSHFLADGGNSFSPENYSFNVASGKSFTVVVHEVGSGGGVGSAYNLDVSLSQCSIVYTFNGNGNWE